MLTSQTLRICRSAYLNLADLSGFNSLVRRNHRNLVTVLSYHGVIGDQRAQHPLRLDNMVTVSEFEEQMREVTRLFHPISMSDLRNWLHGRSTPPANPVLITFDDGYANNLSLGVPTLARMGIPAVFFIATGYIGTRRMLWPTEIFYRAYHWSQPQIPLPRGGYSEVPRQREARIAFATKIEESCKYIPMIQVTTYLDLLRQGDTPRWSEAETELFGFLDWDDVRKLVKSGFEIGSHTVEHPILSRISEDRLAYEVNASKARIEEETGNKCFCFSYPNGKSWDLTPAAVKATSDAGYEYAFSLMDGIAESSSDPMLLDRVWIPGRIGYREFRTRSSGIHGLAKRLIRHEQRLTT